MKLSTGANSAPAPGAHTPPRGIQTPLRFPTTPSHFGPSDGAQTLPPNPSPRQTPNTATTPQNRPKPSLHRIDNDIYYSQPINILIYRLSVALSFGSFLQKSVSSLARYELYTPKPLSHLYLTSSIFCVHFDAQVYQIGRYSPLHGVPVLRIRLVNFFVYSMKLQKVLKPVTEPKTGIIFFS